MSVWRIPIRLVCLSAVLARGNRGQSTPRQTGRQIVEVGADFFLDVSEQKLTWGWEELSTHAALCWERDADSSVASGFTSCCHKDSRIKSSRLRGVSLLFWVLCELLLHVCTFLSVSLFHFWRKETGGKIRRNYKSKNVVNSHHRMFTFHCCPYISVYNIEWGITGRWWSYVGVNKGLWSC